MKNYWILIALFLGLTFCINSLAKCQNVYTIGAYDKAFNEHTAVMKLGPLSAAEIPPVLPKSFLEKDGSYAGGEAFCKITQACVALIDQLERGILPKNESWHIYLLDADWNQDTYVLLKKEFRIKHSVKVLNIAYDNCQKKMP